MNKNLNKDKIDISHKNLSRVEFASEISPLSKAGKKLKKAEDENSTVNESTIKYKPVFTENEKENV